MRAWSICAVLLAGMHVHGACAQDRPPDLTPAGKEVLQGIITANEQSMAKWPDTTKPTTFPLAMCAFPGGLCGAVRRDGSVAVPPRYDWVGPFADGRAAVRVGGLYGFVDEDGREVVTPQYRIVDDYKFGFAQVDMDGKSGLIDRDGKMIIEPKYGFVVAIASDRFRVSEFRRTGGTTGSENFSGRTIRITDRGVTFSGPHFDAPGAASGIIAMSGEWIAKPGTEWPVFDKDDPAVRWVKKGALWGLARSDGSWLVEPKFQHATRLSGGLAQAMVDGKTGFIDRTGMFVIEPVFDKVSGFEADLDRSSAERDGIVGAIDKSGAWIFQTNYQQVFPAWSYHVGRRGIFGWHFKQADRWGLLDIDGRVVLDADYDQRVERCFDGRLIASKNKESLYFKSDGRSMQPPDGRLVEAYCGAAPPYTVQIGDKLGLVDRAMTALTPVQFDAIVSAAPGVMNVKVGGKWGRIGSDGRWLLEPRFDYLSAGTDIFVASINGKRGFMRQDGTWLIEPKFEAVRLRYGETAFVTFAGATGVLRLTDQAWVVPPRPGVLCDIGNGIIGQATESA